MVKKTKANLAADWMMDRFLELKIELDDPLVVVVLGLAAEAIERFGPKAGLDAIHCMECVGDDLVQEGFAMEERQDATLQ